MAECIESGYRWCWEDQYCHPDIPSLCAHPKIYWRFEDEAGNDVWDTYPYAVGGLYIKYGYSGNFGVYAYGFYNVSSWDNIWNRFSANENGFNISSYDLLFPQPQGGRIKIADVGETFTKCVVLVAYDWNTDGNDWVSMGTGVGFIGSGNCVNIQVVSPTPQGIRASVSAEYSVPSGTHQFDIWILYGKDTDGTIERFAETGHYEWAFKQFNVSAPGQSVVTEIDMPGSTVANFPPGTYDALVRILKESNGDRLCDWKIYNNVFTR